MHPSPSENPPPGAPKYRLRFLGGLDLTDGNGDSRTELLKRRKPFALFAYLALAKPDAYLQREALCALFWPDSDHERSRASLRQSLAAIRKALPDVLDQRGDEEVRLVPGMVTSDVDEFRRAVQEGRGAGAIRIYGGTFLDAFHIRGSWEFGEWADGIRRELARLREGLEGTERDGGADSHDQVTGQGKDGVGSAQSVASEVRDEHGTNPAANRSTPDPRLGAARPNPFRWKRLLAPAGLLAAAAILAMTLNGSESTLADPGEETIRIAVLSPRYAGDDADVAALAHGLHDELIAEIFRVADLSPVPGGTVRQLERQETPESLIASQAGARYLLDSSLQDDGSRIRIDFSLTDAVADTLVWSEVYDRSRASLIDLRIAVSQEVQSALSIRLAGRIDDPWAGLSEQAVESFVLGKGWAGIDGYGEETHERWRKAEAHLNRAVELEPGFARAWATLSMVHLRMYWLNADPTRRRIELATSALAQAQLHGPAEFDTRHAEAAYDYFIGHDYRNTLEIARGLLTERDDPDLARLVFSATRRLGRFEEVVRLMEERLEQRPSELIPMAGDLINTYRRLGWYDDARRDAGTGRGHPRPNQLRRPAARDLPGNGSHRGLSGAPGSMPTEEPGRPVLDQLGGPPL